MENQNNKIDWDDNSGTIHTSSQKYKTLPEDGFQKNHAYYMTNSYGKKNRYIKGVQTGITYTTDDYRIVIPGYIFATIFMIAITIVLFFINIIIGIVSGIFAVLFIYGFWKNASIAKWKNQAKQIKSKKKNM